MVTVEDNPEAAYIVVNLKMPKRTNGIEKLKSHWNAEGSPIGVWTSGSEGVVKHRVEPKLYRSLSDIPSVQQTLASIAAEGVVWAQLSECDKLVTERLALTD